MTMLNTVTFELETLGIKFWVKKIDKFFATINGSNISLCLVNVYSCR